MKQTKPSLPNPESNSQPPPSSPTPIIINPNTSYSTQTTSQILHINVKPKPKLSITFTFNHQTYSLSLAATSTIPTLKSLISPIIHISPSNISISYNNKSYTDDTTTKLSSIITQAPPSCAFEVKKKLNYIPNEPKAIQPHNTVYRVLVRNFPSENELVKVIDLFYKECCIINSYDIKKVNDTTWIVGFDVADIAFDFKRYLLVLKGRNGEYKDIQAKICFDKKCTNKKGSCYEKNANCKRDYNEYTSALYVNMSGEYMTSEERKRKEELESKKKWVNKNGFIPYAKNKNSEICNKYLY